MAVIEKTPDEARHRAVVPGGVPAAASPDVWAELGPMPAEAAGSMAIRQSVASALVALRMNRTRAFLTALGIIIGVAAVITMVSLGAGASANIQQRLAGLGTNLLTIQPGGGGPPGEVRPPRDPSRP